MDITQQGIVTLIKSAVTEQAMPLPDGFDLETAMVQIRRHHLVPVAYDGALRCGISQDTPVMQQLFRGYCKAIQIHEGQMAEVGRVREAFEEAGIDYMLLKGSVMKDLYPKPELRMMGDADILVREEQYHRVVPVVQGLGFEMMDGQDMSNYQIAWDTPRLHLEVHRHLVPEPETDLREVLGNGWNRALKESGNRYTMSPEDMFLFYFCHFTKHYRYGGIGCRHVLDLWVYRKENPTLNLEKVKQEIEKLGLLEFFENIMDLLRCWFENGERSEKLDLISEYVFSNGSWGTAESHATAAAVWAISHRARIWPYRMAYGLYYLFPARKVLMDRYKVLEKAPWLLPGVWVVRIFRKLLFERNDVRQRMRDVSEMNREQVDRRVKLLRYMGLETKRK